MEISDRFLEDLEIISEDVFRIRKVTEGRLFLKNFKYPLINYYIYYRNISEEEIIQLVKILVEAYSIYHDDYDTGFRTRAEVSTMAETKDLNTHLEYSPKFVRAVLELEGSSLHKLFLLSSGVRMLSRDRVDLLVLLAQTKDEESSDPKNAILRRPHNPRTAFEDVYILPGVSSETLGLGTLSFALRSEDSEEINSRFKLNLQIMAFFSEDSETVTMEEFLKKDLLDSIVSQGSLKDMQQIANTKAVLTSQYAEFARSMKARELESLAFILGGKAWQTDIPRDFLLNRARSMADGGFYRAAGISRSSRSISAYLSKTEKKTLLSYDDVGNERMAIAERGISSHLLRISCAALAEVLSIKGESKTIEILAELKNMARPEGLMFHRATVMLILEALKPDADDYPFGWIAQFSEHSWVLSHEVVGNDDEGSESLSLTV